MDQDDDVPILELSDDDRVPADADAPLEDLPVLSRADDDVYELSRSRNVGKAKSPPKQRARQPVPPASSRRPVPRPRKSPSSRTLWIVGAIGLFGFIAFVTVGVLVFRKHFAEEAVKVADMVRNHPILIEELGGIDECKMNFLDSLDNGDTDTDLYDVRGPKGSGQLVAEEVFGIYLSIKLRTAKGEWELLDDDEDSHDSPVGTPEIHSPVIAQETDRPPTRSQPTAPPQSVAPTRPRTLTPKPAEWAPLPKDFVVAENSKPLKPGTPVLALFGATWHPAEVVAVSPDGSLRVYWPHLGHNFNRTLPRSMIAVSNETLARLASDPDSFKPSFELAEGSTFPPPTGYVVVPMNLELLPGTPVKLNPGGHLFLDYTVVREADGQVTVQREPASVREEQCSRRKLMIATTVIEQLSEPEAQQKFAARLKEVQAKNPFSRTGNPTAERMMEQMRKGRPAHQYRITIAVPESAERVTKETPLAIGTRCYAEWGRRWNVVTVTALRENGDVEVKWDGWSTIEPVTRDSLTIDKKTLAELIAKQKLDGDSKTKSEANNDDSGQK